MASPAVRSATVLSAGMGEGKEKECGISAMEVDEAETAVATLKKLGVSVSAPNVPGIPADKAADILAVKEKLLEQVPNVNPMPMDTSGTASTLKQRTHDKEVRLSDSGLETLIMRKIAAVLGCDGEQPIIKLKDKILEVNQSKDKVAQKLISMQKQIDELNRAVVENSEYMQNPTDGPPAPLKFFRSVGLQVNSDSKAQLSLLNSANVRGSKEVTLPFKRNGALVGPASVKRNYANKMAEVSASSAPPIKKPATSPPVASTSRTDVVELDEDIKMEVGSTSNGDIGVGVRRSPVAQPGQSVPNPPNIVFRSPAPAPNVNIRQVVPRAVGVAGGTSVRSAAPRPGAPTRFQVGAQQTRSRFALPPIPPPSNYNKIPQSEGLAPPPRPLLTLKGAPDGIVLSWTHPMENNNAEITNYQIYACQEALQGPTKVPIQWKRVGDVKALPLPMACTLSQFTNENRYYFLVRGVDVFSRTGPFCEVASIVKRKSTTVSK